MVRLAVERGWAGLECLSGIPGLVGATPIQNVGAYGQEVSDTIAAVRALDRATRKVVTLPTAACGFGYRDSAFKSGTPDRHVILGVTYRLRPGGAARRSATRSSSDTWRRAGSRRPTLADVRESVLAVRRAKSMVLDAGGPEPAELRLVLREPRGPGGGGGAHRGRSRATRACRGGRSREGSG